MGTHDTAIQNQPFHIWLTAKVLEHVAPDAMFTPAGKAFIDAIPMPILRRQFAPLGAAATHPEHAFQEADTVAFLAYISSWMGSQKRDDFCPLFVV